MKVMMWNQKWVSLSWLRETCLVHPASESITPVKPEDMSSCSTHRPVTNKWTLLCRTHSLNNTATDHKRLNCTVLCHLIETEVGWKSSTVMWPHSVTVTIIKLLVAVHNIPVMTC